MVDQGQGSLMSGKVAEVTRLVIPYNFIPSSERVCRKRTTLHLSFILLYVLLRNLILWVNTTHTQSTLVTAVTLAVLRLPGSACKKFLKSAYVQRLRGKGRESE